MRAGLSFARSDKDYDWLGPGIYFWEADPKRALEWAQWKKDKGEYENPFVIGAAIDLGNCLDLMSREDLEMLAWAYDSFREIHEKDGRLDEMPENKRGPDKLLRILDCAVIKHLHSIIEAKNELEPVDTVRGLFTEGEEVFPGSGFKRKTHVQIAVRNVKCIKGVFRVSETEFED